MKRQNLLSLLIGITIFAAAAFGYREDRVLKPEATVDLRTAARVSFNCNSVGASSQYSAR